jgi:glutaredoxin
MTIATTPMKPLRTLSLSAVFLLAATLAAGAAAQYRWLDNEGKVHYGDAPPRDAKDVRSLGTRAAPAPAIKEDSTRNLPFELRRAVERAPVVVYTAPECQPCAPAVALLRDRGVPYTERTVVSPEDVQEFRRISGGLRLPYLTIGSQAQSGFNPDIWLSLLDAAGYPKGSVLPRDYQWPAGQPLVPQQAEAKAQGTVSEQAAAPTAAPAAPAAPAPAKRQ